jgi:hypothetical protein
MTMPEANARIKGANISRTANPQVSAIKNMRRQHGLREYSITQR